MKKVVVIGGGTGTFTVLSSLVNKNYSLSVLLTMVDDGGSNKVLRDEFGLLPTSGVRLAMVALSSEQSLLRELFTYRFNKGVGISGMTFGNLFLAAVTDIVGSQEKAIEATSKLLSVKGEIIPISYGDVKLVAELENGLKVVGEHEIDEPKHDGKLRIKKLTTEPVAHINPHARDEILEADAIILGPGDFYTNTIANLIIDGVVPAIIKSKAKLIFVTNLMTKYGEAYNYKVSDYVKDLGEYLPAERLDTILINDDTDYPESAIRKYEKEQSIPVDDDMAHFVCDNKASIVREPLVLKKEYKAQKGDVLKRSMIRHSQQRLGEALQKIIDSKWMSRKEKAEKVVGELKKLFPKTKTALGYNSDFNLLVAVILSAQTTDKKVNEVSPSLFKDYRIAEDYSKLSQEKLEKYISSIGLYRGKAKNILATAKIIHNKYNDKLPQTMDEMVALPGVGRKTANIVLGAIYGLITGIAVDTHVKRLSNLFGLTDNSNPDKIEEDLMELLPREEWQEFTLRMIDYGRKYCPARHNHTDCPLREFIK